jgi:hypothetical protein
MYNEITQSALAIPPEFQLARIDLPSGNNSKSAVVYPHVSLMFTISRHSWREINIQRW